MKTLWSATDGPDPVMLEFTAGEDREWDRHLLGWDVIGSLGHLEGLARAKLITGRDHQRLKRGLRAAYRAVVQGKLIIGADAEDAHSAVENWLTKRLGSAGERLHTGRSRNDQIVCDLRLFLKDRLLAVHRAALGLAGALLDFAGRNETALWPGYTHLRRAMPSSAGLWATALAEGLLDTAESAGAAWTMVDRSPLGSAAGYGVPLPIEREVAARALGFAQVEHAVGSVQNGRGKVEAQVLFWAVQLGHDLSRLAADVILLSGEEFGLLRLPNRYATGSSIMPHKRNPDLFELIRGRVALLEADLAAVLSLRSKLTSGYHRDFQLLKEPLISGLARIEGMLGMVALVVPHLEVDRDRGAAALAGGALATDEVMRRVERGEAFRSAYRAVADEFKAGAQFPAPKPRDLIARRGATGGLGNLDLGVPKRRLREAARWNDRERRRFERAIARLVGRRSR